ncbi:MAG: 3-methyl-2-oxobutanoate dehydrogenase subunit VorB [Chloroflexi bacterium]|nr:3-methyl-2-oxobutanoate dehydrogenase subunit VorB [Chloroflexota bacterium]
MAKQLWKGNEAIAEAAVRAGLEAYFGYPITPQTELLEYLATRLPGLKNSFGGNRVFLQAESELAAINMVYGAAVAGARTMTSSSSPGFSLMQEGLSYIAASQAPCVVVNVMRGGPGLGNLAPTQADYFQMTKGGGHGDYHPIVLAPATVQEAVDLTYGAFDLAEKYRAIVILAIDGNIGQMMEPVEMPPLREIRAHDRGWELTGAVNRPRRFNSSLFLLPEELEHMNRALSEKDAAIRANEVRCVEQHTDNADLVIVAFGSAARIAQTAVKEARARGLQVGLFRPLSLYPFPEKRLTELSYHVHQFLVVEMSAGQMVQDVQLAVERDADVHFFGTMGGIVPLPDEILAQIEKYMPMMLPNETDQERDVLDVAYTC